VALILLSNDDGIEAEGLSFLEASVQGLANIVVVAPDRERSAVSHGLTIHSQLSLTQIDASHFTLNGTPADCIIHALRHLLPSPPDLVISGVNHGANLGDDIMYSGTVAGAREALRYGITSLAISQAYDERPVRFKGGDFIRRLAADMLEGGSKEIICLNVNIPVRKIRGVKITRQGCASHFHHFNYLKNGDVADPKDPVENCGNSDIALDYAAIVENYISITPLRRDQTDYEAAKSLASDVQKLFPRSLMPGFRLIGQKN